MTKVTLGRYALRQNGSFFASDALWVPNHGVLGIASSTHHYDLYPIAERDVQAAFDIVRAALVGQNLVELSGTELLRGLLEAIHRGFSGINMHTHVTGIEFDRSRSVSELINDPEATPRVQIALLQLEGRRLSIACVGNLFLVYRVRSTGQEIIFGWDWLNSLRAVIEPDWPGPFILGCLDMPKVYSCEVEVRPGDLIVVATGSLMEAIATARLDRIASAVGCDLKAINRHLMDTLKSIAPEDSLDSTEPWGSTERAHKSPTLSLVRMWGAAWAIACVEE